MVAVTLIFKMFTRSGHDSEFFAVLSAFAILAAWFYFAALESSRWQATLGKMAVGLRVTDIEGHRFDPGPRPGSKPRKVSLELEPWHRLSDVRIHEEEAGAARHNRELHRVAAPIAMNDSKSHRTRYLHKCALPRGGK